MEPNWKMIRDQQAALQAQAMAEQPDDAMIPGVSGVQAIPVATPVEPEPDYGSMDDAQLRKLMQVESLKAMRSRQAGMEDQNFLAQQALARPVNLDLSGAFEIVKALGGSPNAGANYKAPSNDASEQLATAMKNKAAIQAQIQDDRTNMLKTLLEDKKADKEGRLAKQYLDNKEFQGMMYVENKYLEADKPFKDFLGKKSAIENAIKDGSYNRIRAIVPMMVKAAGDSGALSEFDQKNQIPTTIQSKLSEWMAKADVNAPMPDDVLQYFAKNINGLYGGVKERYKTSIDLLQEDMNLNPFTAKAGQAFYKTREKRYFGPEAAGGKSKQGGSTQADLDAQIAAEEKRLQELGAMK
jgi:hypothetical protein